MPPPTTRRSAWLGVVLAVLALSSAAIAAVGVVRERAEQQQLAAMAEGLELLRIERDISVVATRLIVSTTTHMFAGGGESEVATNLEAFRASLESAHETLENHAPSSAWRPIHQGMVTAVRGALEQFDEPRNDSELISWTDEFLFDYKRVIPTDNLGEWTSVLEVSTWTLEGALIPRFYLDMALARSWDDGTASPVDSMLIDDLQFTLASMRQTRESHGARAVTYTPFEEYLLTDRANEAGPGYAALVQSLKNHPAVVQIEGDTPYLLGLSTERSFRSVDELFGQIGPFADEIEVESEEVRLLAAHELDTAIAVSRRRDLLARTGGLIAFALTIGLAGRLIQRRRRIEVQLRHAAEQDVLTGVYSRFGLFARAPEMLSDEQNAGFALIHLDMDDFKSINDRCGHHVGDAALCRFAEMCRTVIRDDRDIVARIGGDEFVMVLTGLREPEAEARSVIDRLRERLHMPVKLEEFELQLVASAGYATSDQPIVLQELMVEADLALLAAKERGRNECELFRLSLRRTVLRELERGMENGELRCAFQPQFDLVTGNVIGLEGLVRWHRPDHEEIDALRLVDAIVWLGQSLNWLQVAMRDVERMYLRIADEVDGRIWVNLTGRDVSTSSAAELIDILDATTVPLSRIGVELTEPVLRGDLEPAIDKLRRIREAGIAVALDDVGNDRIPLLHVAELPIDVVKLDRSVVDGIDHQPGLRYLVQSLTELCDRMSLRMLAEGVETPAQEHVLRSLGVRYVQGFRFARPLSLDGVVALLEGLDLGRRVTEVA